MRRCFLCGILTVAILVSGVMNAQAQLGVGVKVPPFYLPAFVLSYIVSETQILELDVAYQSSSAISTLSMGITGKLYLETEEVGHLSMTSFLGAGVRIALFSFRVLGETLPVTVLSVNLLVGWEYRIPDSPYRVFAEMRNSFSPASFGVGVGVALGVRIDL